jgi:hypothetical protein
MTPTTASRLAMRKMTDAWEAALRARLGDPPSIACETVVVRGADDGVERMVALSASAVMQDRRRLRRQVADVGRCCQRAGIPLILGGAGAWPDPPDFGQRVRRWDDFNAALRISEVSR